MTFLEPLLYGPNIRPQGNNNYSELDDPKVNNAIETASKIPINKPEAADAWTQANKLATESGAWVPIRWYLDRDLGSEKLRGGYWHAYYTALDWANAGVAR